MVKSSASVYSNRKTNCQILRGPTDWYQKLVESKSKIIQYLTEIGSDIQIQSDDDNKRLYLITKLSGCTFFFYPDSINIIIYRNGIAVKNYDIITNTYVFSKEFLNIVNQMVLDNEFC